MDNSAGLDIQQGRYCVRRKRWLLVPFWSVIFAAGVSILAFGFPALYAVPIGAPSSAVAAAGLLNYGFYSKFCIDQPRLTYQDWFGLVQRSIPLSQLTAVENIRTHGSSGYTWLLAIRWHGGLIALNRSYYSKADIATIVRMILSASPSARISEAVSNLAEASR